MPSDREVRAFEAEIEASPEEVYHAITEPSEFKVWDPFRVKSEFRPGGGMTWRFQGSEGGVRFSQADPWRFTGEFIPETALSSQFELELTPTARGVRVTGILREVPTDPDSVEVFSAAEQGWGGWVENLKAHVELAKGRVLTKVVEDLRVATFTVEGDNDVEHLLSRLGETGPKVIEKVRSQRASAVGSVLVYHAREPWKVEVGCVLEGDLESENELQVRKLTGGLVVSRPYRRYSYDYGWFLQNGLEKWSRLNGYRPVGPVREIYTENIWLQKEPVPGEIQLPVMREKSS